MTNSEVTAKLNTLKATYATGKFWNHDPKSANSPTSIRTVPCTHHGNCNTATGSCGCNCFGGGIQCHGFAKYMSSLVFGTFPNVTTSPAASNGTDVGSGWKLYTDGYCESLTLEPGDFIRKNGHSAIVHTVSGSTVNVGEVWGAPSNPAYNCKIAWGFFNSSSANTAQVILQTATYIVKAPKTGGGGGASTYRITNVGASKCLNISGSNVTVLSNGMNVTLWSNSGTNEQKWSISSLGSNVYIKSIIDTQYGLNVYRSGNPYNCNIYKIAGNETDTAIDIIASGSNYKIKLRNYALYLTVGASADNTNVYWAASSSSNYQNWSMTKL